jgi:poly(A) polymerase
MNYPANHLLKNPQLITLTEVLSDFPQVGKMFLVGGAVRDALLGRSPVDFDFTSEYDPTPLARTFATRCGGYWFWLDEQRRQSRVGTGNGTFDFAPWRAQSLAGDLAARDFTINAMAIDLTKPFGRSVLIDPLGGRNDLSGRILRRAGPDVLLVDPLRVLKGIRHAVELELEIEPATLRAMQSIAAKLTTCTPERLRVEIWRILAAPAVCRGLDWLVECGGAKALFGEDFCIGTAMVQRSLRRTNALFASLSGDSSTLVDWLCEPVEQSLDRKSLLQWCRALGAINAELPLMTAHRWRFSRTALSRIAALRTLAPHLWQELLHLPHRPRPIAL